MRSRSATMSALARSTSNASSSAGSARSSLEGASGRVTFGLPKKHRRRSVPIARFLVDPLAEHMEGLRPDDLVFTAPEGGPLRNPNLPQASVRPSSRVRWTSRPAATRPSAHRREPRSGGRRQRQGGPADARPCLRSDDAWRVRRAVRGRLGRPRGSTARCDNDTACGLSSRTSPW